MQSEVDQFGALSLGGFLLEEEILSLDFSNRVGPSQVGKDFFEERVGFLVEQSLQEKKGHPH